MNEIISSIVDFMGSTGIAKLIAQPNFWQTLVMFAISFVLCYLAIVKGFEPLLLLPIAIGMLLTNLPGAEMFHDAIFINETGYIDTDFLLKKGGLLDYLYLGVKLGIYPSLIFIGIGAMTDFTPLIANPKSLIIGGADGPTAILVTKTLAPHLLGAIAIAAYSYMALIPLIQPPFMRMLTTEKERKIKMTTLRTVSRTEKLLFPIVVTCVVCLLIPDAAPLVGCLMFGNLLNVCGVTDRLSKTAQNELMNIVTIFLGITVGATAKAENFLRAETILIICLGLAAFIVSTVGGLLTAKVMCFLTKGQINPLIGSAGVSAVPMAARVANLEGQKADPSNFLLMHAMGPNVAGVIGSAVAAGVFLTWFTGFGA